MSSDKARILKVLAGITASLAVAVVIAALVRPWLLPPTFSVSPDQLELSQADVGPQFALLRAAHAGPSNQHALNPPRYFQDFRGGRYRFFIARSALSPEGRSEIDSWLQAHGFDPTQVQVDPDVPLIVGSFVEDHSGIFEINDVELSYSTTDSAHLDYLCCDYGRAETFHDYQTKQCSWVMKLTRLVASFRVYLVSATASSSKSSLLGGAMGRSSQLSRSWGLMISPSTRYSAWPELSTSGLRWLFKLKSVTVAATRNIV